MTGGFILGPNQLIEEIMWLSDPFSAVDCSTEEISQETWVYPWICNLAFRLVLIIDHRSVVLILIQELADWPSGQIQPSTSFCKSSLMVPQLLPFIDLFSRAALVL